MSAPPLSPTEYARAHVRTLHADAPALAAEFVADCRNAHALAAERATKAVAVARYHHDVLEAAEAAYKAAGGGA